MAIKSSSWIIRYYRFLLQLSGKEEWQIQDRLGRINNLCQLIRNVVLRTIVVLFMLTFVLTLLAIFATQVYLQPLGALIVLMVMVTAVGTLLAIIFGVERYNRYRKGLPPKPPGVIRTYLRAVKQGVCPLVKIEKET